MSIRFNRIGILCVVALICVIIFVRRFRFGSSDTNRFAQLLPEDSILDDNADRRVRLASLLSSAIAAATLGGREVLHMSATMSALNVRSKGKTHEGANDPVTDADLRSHCAMWRRLRDDQPPSVRIVSEEEADNAKCATVELLEDVEQQQQYLSTTVGMDLSTKLGLDEAQHVDEWVLAKDVTIWIDPLDATQEFTEHLFQYVTVMVCVAIRGRPIIGVIHDPFTQHTSWAWNRPPISSFPPHTRTETSRSFGNQTIVVSRSHHGDAGTFITERLGAGTRIVHAGGAGYKVLQVVNGMADAYVHTTNIKKWDLCAGNAIVDAVGGRMTDRHGNAIDYGAAANVVNTLGVLATSQHADHEAYVRRLANKT